MANFVALKSTRSESDIVVNLDHIISVEPYTETECVLLLSTDKRITVEEDFEELSMRLISLSN